MANLDNIQTSRYGAPEDNYYAKKETKDARSTRIYTEDHQLLRKIAFHTDKTMTDLLSEALRDLSLKHNIRSEQ
ncbi:hypothetical protein ACQKEX_14485 [Bacillus pumilus]|uniref:hypothetical protein n=1 Tax=Bacillaceae TaxID=186817 RepID=UPI00096753EF|nr:MULTISPECIES: hypothetical protein [Bacillaceae]MBU8576463.1 hypothetical protein [Bacillus pumilus]OLP64337.1 hypothetical protein BACPU_25620 [Bacillus pumilus]